VVNVRPKPNQDAVSQLTTSWQSKRATTNIEFWPSSHSSLGFKGSRRSTNYAAQATAENAAWTTIQLGIESVEVRIKGLGYGKESSLRGLRLGGLIITKIQDVSPTPHNGCRPPKKSHV